MSSCSNLKRPPAVLPSPHQMAQVFKKPRLAMVLEQKDSQPPNTLETEGGNTQKPKSQKPASDSVTQLQHSLPLSLYPLVSPPYKVSDFFTDLQPAPNPSQKAQMAQITNVFPPPLPPILPKHLQCPDGGISVPFVYPSIPVLRPDVYLADRVQKRRGRRPAAEVMAAKTTKGRMGVPDADIYPVMAPLPFPAAPYMPYPLFSDQASLTPHEVFGDWLEASENLPRVDMVVASAAGSIFDLGAVASSAGWTVSKLDHYVRNHKHESDPEAEDDRSDTESADLPSGYKLYADYADQVDISNAFDANARPRPSNVVITQSKSRHEYTKVVPIVSDRGRSLMSDFGATCEYADRDIQEDAEMDSEEASNNTTSADATENNEPDVDGNTSGTGDGKPVFKGPKRRWAELSYEYDKISAKESRNRETVYASRKWALLARLRSLQNTKINFGPSEIADDELREYAHRRQVQRDMELVQLKHFHTYERLKAALAFYQNSNRAYKNMSIQLVNKLGKLKHFFEYQKQIFQDITKGRNAHDSDTHNIRTKESARLYDGFVEQDYSSRIKDVFRASVANEDKGLPLDSHPDFDASWFEKVFTEREHAANVHDFMPLVTEEEFKLITGDAPVKNGPGKESNGKSKGAKHSIFQSPLYDVTMSGSEANGSDSGVVVKKRPGRRAAPKSTLAEEPTKQQTEAALVAKIMKSFVGPAAANPEELTNDLDLIGIKTRWPVK
ncbi:hypothetical protein EJF18_80187 [Clavispora lusitaniae]|uniref:Uncharacterized protein n=1 Tax=Clavispora lusitaniae TaxID=36911 RepID=A0ACD0WSC0_CLALS|nr:hypothetical protein EJF14_80187 [Clavispora lusitaniae]QFZ36130.1 hypothetical protein EJF16_80187 [Clavispora lusitaniae]QFZ41814.1 hypothetical protein EJF15_80187 [Clavispora lusitaniae]QFZ47490.1 hypothetical protein EJF18_80187 [Clavispora lusitaniae]QFZ53169.1 hypothetical protein EJF17_80187 [Clavispora lusitaniae]